MNWLQNFPKKYFEVHFFLYSRECLLMQELGMCLTGTLNFFSFFHY
jgi:hypothetical protein